MESVKKVNFFMAVRALPKTRLILGRALGKAAEARFSLLNLSLLSQNRGSGKALLYKLFKACL
jgi:hypothetical protein